MGVVGDNASIVAAAVDDQFRSRARVGLDVDLDDPVLVPQRQPEELPAVLVEAVVDDVQAGPGAAERALDRFCEEAAAASDRGVFPNEFGRHFLRAELLRLPSLPLAVGESLRLVTPIGRRAHPLLGLIWSAEPGGLPAVSRLTLLERRDDADLVAVAIASGRPHQIRIHCAAAGAPLLFVVLALFIVLLTENSRVPVDDPATHLELTMIHEVMVLDHSGPDFGFIEMGSFLKMFFYASIVSRLILPFELGHPALNLGLFSLGLLIVYVAVGVTEDDDLAVGLDAFADEFGAGVRVVSVAEAGAEPLGLEVAGVEQVTDERLHVVRVAADIGHQHVAMLHLVGYRRKRPVGGCHRWAAHDPKVEKQHHEDDRTIHTSAGHAHGSSPLEAC